MKEKTSTTNEKTLHGVISLVTRKKRKSFVINRTISLLLFLVATVVFFLPSPSEALSPRIPDPFYVTSVTFESADIPLTIKEEILESGFRLYHLSNSSTKPIYIVKLQEDPQIRKHYVGEDGLQLIEASGVKLPQGYLSRRKIANGLAYSPWGTKGSWTPMNSWDGALGKNIPQGEIDLFYELPGELYTITKSSEIPHYKKYTNIKNVEVPEPQEIMIELFYDGSIYTIGGTMSFEINKEHEYFQPRPFVRWLRRLFGING